MSMFATDGDERMEGIAHDFTEEERPMSWTGQNWSPEELRFVTDLTGDGRADIVGFGRDGVWVGVNIDGSTFSQPHMVLTSFNSQGWHRGQHLRLVVDLTGDGKADIIGFGDHGVGTAVNNGDGTFALDKPVLEEFGVDHGWRVEQHPRFVVDVTGDGKADIVGFGNDGVWTALGNGDGTFQAPKLVLTNFGVNQGWRVEQHPRFVVDVTGDGKADIVGFGNDGVWTALGNGDGTFQAPKLVLEGFNVNQGWRVEQHPRFVVDLTGDRKADIVGFGNDGVWTAVSNGDGTFQAPRLVLEGFNVNQGWRVEQHPRFVADLTGDRKADIVIAYGDVIEKLAKLHSCVPFTHLFAHEEIGNALTFRRDRAVAQWCRQEGVAYREFPQSSVRRGGVNRDRLQEIWKSRIANVTPLPIPAIRQSADLRLLATSTTFPKLPAFVPNQHWQPVSETDGRDGGLLGTRKSM